MTDCGKQKPLPTILGKRYAFPTFPPPPPRLLSLKKKGKIVVRDREKMLDSDQLGRVRLDPAPNATGVHLDTSFGHQLCDVLIRQRISEIQAHAGDD